MIFIYLSENDTLPSIRAAEEDGLHVWIKNIIIGEERDQVAEMAARAARVLVNDKNTYPCNTAEADAATRDAIAWAEAQRADRKNENYSRILSDKFARLYFLTLSRLPAHFRHSKDLKIKTTLERHNGNMGVSELYSIKFVLSLTHIGSSRRALST